jgi:RHH-type proline utilization regulon transcriptional repressor/proline dehydrogenase/delta 1-pyrroline-5-carboxylate dehydrogenase
LGEQVLGEGEAKRYTERYLNLVADLASHPKARRRTPGDIPEHQVSIKLSSLVADYNPIDVDGTIARVSGPLVAIARACRRHGIGLTIDMEQYEYRDLTWRIFMSAFMAGAELGDWEDIGIVIQAYLRDAEAFADKVVSFAKQRGASFQVRLVKGAYWDYETIVAQQRGWPIPVFTEKGETDLTFETLVWKLLEGGRQVIRLAVGSHNPFPRICRAVREHFTTDPVTKRHRTAEADAALAAMGWVSRDYLPSGDLLAGMSYLCDGAGECFPGRIPVPKSCRCRRGHAAAPATASAGAGGRSARSGAFQNQPRRLFWRRSERACRSPEATREAPARNSLRWEGAR